MRGWLAVLVLSGCVPTGVDEDVRQGGSRHAIIGGEPTGPTDPEVFALYDQTGQFFCTATLIHPRVLLTAAHCVEHGVAHIGNAPNGPYDRSLRVVRTWADTRYFSVGAPEYDVGLVLFSPESPLIPRPIARRPLGVSIGDSVRAVGFGVQAPYVLGEPDPPYGERRTVDLRVTNITPGLIHIGEMGRAVCFGDSGGPLFGITGGVERVVGVHSYTNDDTCSGGASTRVDPHADAIDAWILANATATCEQDGVCVAGCPQLDLDCACAPDGACTADCTQPSLDPDCPRFCDPSDGFCAWGVCPIPDADCRPTGSSCVTDVQCVEHVCMTTDSQHASYCSLVCGRDSECTPFGMTCIFSVCRKPQLPVVTAGTACSAAVRCEFGTKCHASTPTISRCEKPCASQAECPRNFVCQQGASDFRACTFVAPPVKVTSVPTTLGEATVRCSVAGQSAAVMLVALLLQRRRRRASRSTASEKIAPPPVEHPPRTIIGSATES